MLLWCEFTRFLETISTRVQLHPMMASVKCIKQGLTINLRACKGTNWRPHFIGLASHMSHDACIERDCQRNCQSFLQHFPYVYFACEHIRNDLFLLVNAKVCRKKLTVFWFSK
ncbi:hypothetical protein AT242_06480 [Bartonella henselae]|nr:hypothetical protein AT244_06170 [Bartonella henselae]OLL46923.1 hypothetical protein AT242_06480 [Bartonella henselae]